MLYGTYGHIHRFVLFYLACNSRCACVGLQVPHVPCVQTDSCSAHFGKATSGYIPHIDQGIYSGLSFRSVAIHQDFRRSCLAPPVPGPIIVLCSLPPNHRGITGPIADHSCSHSEQQDLWGLFFPLTSCFMTLATQAPSRVFCHAVTVYMHYRAPFSCGWDLRFCFAVGKDLFLGFWC